MYSKLCRNRSEKWPILEQALSSRNDFMYILRQVELSQICLKQESGVINVVKMYLEYCLPGKEEGGASSLLCLQLLQHLGVSALCVHHLSLHKHHGISIQQARLILLSQLHPPALPISLSINLSVVNDI